MKRFTILLTGVLAMVLLAGAASAADFSGNWIAFKMSIDQGGEAQTVDMDAFGVPAESRPLLEFKDGKPIFRENAQAEVDEGMPYTADGDKLIVTIPDEEKALAGGLESIEYSFEGGDLVMTMIQGGDAPGTVKYFFKKQ